MIRVHHNTAKRAAKFGIRLEVVENEVEAYKGDRLLTTSPAANVALDRAIAKLNGEAAPAAKASPKPSRRARDEDDDEDGQEDQDDDEATEGDDDTVESETLEGDDEEASEDEGEGRSIVKRKYKQRYRPFHMRCGDSLAEQITAHVMVEDDAGEMRVDRGRLERFAKANDVWVPAYRSLNSGLARMNVGNRLRAKVRKDPAYKIDWAV